MKGLVVIKCCVFVMTFMLLAGFVLLVYKIADKYKQSKLKDKNTVVEVVKSSPDTQNFDFALEKTENISSMESCGAFICLLTSHTRLLIINPVTGSVHKIINLTK